MAAVARVLVVDDEPRLLSSLRIALGEAGYEVLTATDGEAALKHARESSLDLVVLDLVLPKLSGLEVCRILRQESAVPILILTARDDVIDKVLGLELGADDYLTKPFSMRELVARIKALLRRKEMDSSCKGRGLQRALRKGDLLVDLISRRATCSGKLLPLKPKELDLLVLMMSYPGRTFTQDELLKMVWGFDAADHTRTVVVHIGGLRKKLAECCQQHDLIETVRGAGYRFRD